MNKEIKIPYTKNTVEARQVLQSLGYKPLSFFQGKKYVFGIISDCANAYTAWQEKDYSTFDNREAYHETKPCDLQTFTKKLKNYEN
ncbi:hypothetical protein V2E39_22805 [Chryseobacterium arthrosphaerae]|uniref:Uncharacterized protein n=1 Tax=Chryseobacterium arthrosphaerae TaxID=651561 RepID=A0ABU7R627_9FLAO